MKVHELDINSSVFDDLRETLSVTIAGTVKQMRNRNMSEGTITAKIKVQVLNRADENGEIQSTAIFEPKVTSKIYNSEEEKCRPCGGRITVGEYGKMLIGSEQVTMDELMDNQKGA